MFVCIGWLLILVDSLLFHIIMKFSYGLCLSLFTALLLIKYELPHQKTINLHMGSQRGRSAVQ